MWQWSICGNGFAVVILLRQICYWKLCEWCVWVGAERMSVLLPMPQLLRERFSTMEERDKTSQSERERARTSKSQNVSSDSVDIVVWLLSCLLFNIDSVFMHSASVSCFSAQCSLALALSRRILPCDFNHWLTWSLRWAMRIISVCLLYRIHLSSVSTRNCYHLSIECNFYHSIHATSWPRQLNVSDMC